MLLLFIIISILYLIMIYFVLSLYYKYRKDIEEIENRCLQLEKLINSKLSTEYLDKIYDNLNEKIVCISIEIQKLKNKNVNVKRRLKT